MRDYDKLVTALRFCASGNCDERCLNFGMESGCRKKLEKDSADAIEELLKAAKAMHTWIYLYTGDEQAAYDECGLTDEMNDILGYGGQFVAEPPKEET